MSQLDPVTLKRELALKQALDTQLDALVQRANRAVLVLEKSRMEESGLRNLLNTAMESGSFEVTANFIRYQIGRSRETWQNFGHHVIDDLCALGKEPTEDVIAALKERQIENAESLKSRIHVRLMQLYLGYANRAFVFAKKTGDFERLREVSSGA